MSSKNNNHLNIPEARNAMDQFKMLLCSRKWVSTCWAAITVT